MLKQKKRPAYFILFRSIFDVLSVVLKIWARAIFCITTSFSRGKLDVIWRVTQRKNQAMPTISDFPLIWRWTNASHALFSESELEGLHPCSPAEAARFHDVSRSFDTRTGLDQMHFASVLVQSASISTSEGCSWLRSQASHLAEPVTVSWDRETALRTSWEFFTRHWDDFCYPSSDDVLVVPDSGDWALGYYHDESFYFGNRKQTPRLPTPPPSANSR